MQNSECRMQNSRRRHFSFSILNSALCIKEWSPRLVSRQRLLVFSEALICLSYSGNWLAEPKLGERRLVVPAGNAPASSGYQPGALLLSYETTCIFGFKPAPRGRNTSVTLATGRMRTTRDRKSVV